MIRLLKKLFSKKKDIVVYRDGKTFKFSTFAEAYPYMIGQEIKMANLRSENGKHIVAKSINSILTVSH